ncbi:MAG: WD40 repeat domain-containing protein [Sulfurimonas sp.]|jgi:WD40 repeat protein|uniref:WD40 repeat domain-containing protein n=1 Tax=Sulfurimonas sp. TaxID=2022749 RepID=UPI003565DEB4
MNNNLTTTNQNAKLALSKSKSLLNITNSLLLKTVNSDLTKNFQFKPYLIDTLNCSAKSVAVTPDGETIFSISADNTIKSWDVKSGEHVNTLDRQESVVSSLAITPDGKFIIIGSEKGTIDLCEIKTGKSIRTFNNIWRSGPISSLKVNSSGKYMISISDYDYEQENYDEEDYETLNIWDIESGRCIDIFDSHIHAVTLNREYLVSSYSYYTSENYHIEAINIRNIESGKILDFLEGYVQNHSTKVSSLAITPDGNTIISGGGDDQKTINLWDGIEDAEHIDTVSDGVGIIKVWDISGARYTKVLEGHTDCVYSLAVTPDGKNIVSGSKDNTIKIWDIQSGECVRTLKGHTDAVSSVITQDGKTIISRSKDGTIKLWDIKSGECNYTIYNIQDGSTIIMFSDGYFNASEENIDKFIRIDDTLTSCRTLTKEEIEHFCKVKYENKREIPQTDIEVDEIPF